MKKLMLIFMSMLLMITPALAQEEVEATTPASKVEPTPAPAKNYDAEIEALQKQIAEMKAEMKKPAPAPVEKKAAPVAKKDGDFVAKVGNYIKFYGRARLDYAFESSRTASGATWAFWVLRNSSGTVNGRTFDDNNDYESNISARNSRFGFKLKAIEITTIKAKLSGRFELDFNGGDTSTATWKALPRMRIAALTLDWGWFAIMGGNHWDTFSSHVHSGGDSNTANALIGSVGFRRPQLRFSFKPLIADKHRIWVEAAIARPFDIINADYDGDGNNDGEDSAIPMLQGRVAYEAALWNKTKFMIGVGGHWQRASLNNPKQWLDDQGDVLISKDSFDSWHVDVEMMLPILDNLHLRGEFFYGQMMADIMGGVFQDVNPTSLEEIKSMGGWVDLTYKPFKLWTIIAGYSIDKPDEDSLEIRDDVYSMVDGVLTKNNSAANLEKFRYENSSIYLTNRFNFGSGFATEVTYMYLKTKYRVSKSATELLDPIGVEAISHRALFNISYNF